MKFKEGTKMIMPEKTIQVIAKEHFDRQNGNSYFSARIYLDGHFAFSLPFQYGYESQYLHTTAKKLDELGLIELEKHSNGSFEALWKYCQRKKIELLKSKEEGCSEKEVRRYGSLEALLP